MAPRIGFAFGEGPSGAEAVPVEPARRSRPAAGSIAQQLAQKIAGKIHTQPTQDVARQRRARTRPSWTAAGTDPTQERMPQRAAPARPTQDGSQPPHHEPKPPAAWRRVRNRLIRHREPQPMGPGHPKVCRDFVPPERRWCHCASDLRVGEHPEHECARADLLRPHDLHVARLCDGAPDRCMTAPLFCSVGLPR